MKIITGVVTVIALIGILASCSKRDYTCSCTYTDNITGARVKDVTTVKGVKTTAQNACNSHQGSLKSYNKSDVTCLLQ
jgi:uncharacterized lipoprotein YehR (DUF1307 family)